MTGKLPDIVQKMIKALEVFMAQTETWKLMTGREITDAQAVHIIKSMPGMNERLEHRLTSLWLDHKAELGPTQWALFNTLTYWSTHDDIRQSSVQNSLPIS